MPGLTVQKDKAQKQIIDKRMPEQRQMQTGTKAQTKKRTITQGGEEKEVWEEFTWGKCRWTCTEKQEQHAKTQNTEGTEPGSSVEIAKY